MNTDSEQNFIVVADATNERNIFHKINNFSNEVAHIPGVCRTYICYLTGELNSRDIISLIIYPNGKSIENKGYVSAFLEISDMSYLSLLCPQLDFSCVMSVVDVYGDQKFPQSFIIPQSCFQEGKETLFGIDRFVARETLLREQSDLLPEDTLTINLCCNIPERMHIELLPPLTTEYHLDSSFEEIVGRPGEGRGKLLLDSILVQNLSIFSNYFQRLLETPKTEREHEFIEISKSEFKHLKTFCLMVMRRCYRCLDICDVYEMYAIAHTYAIDIVLQQCREFMKIIVTSENYDDILRIAYKYHDDYLMEIVRNFWSTKYKGKTEADNRNIYRRYSFSGSKIIWDELHKKLHVLCIDESIEKMNYDGSRDLDFYK